MEDLVKSTITDTMRQYCQLDKSCRRQFISTHFGTKLDHHIHHTCCDNCAKLCVCQECCHLSQMTLSSTTTTSVDINAANHDENIALIINHALEQYFKEVHIDQPSPIDPALYTGLTKSLALDISNNYTVLLDKDSLQFTYSFIDKFHIVNIYNIIEAAVNMPT